jgi:hypothetical protein
MKKLLQLVVILFLASTSMFAQVLYEGFEYTTGTFVGGDVTALPSATTVSNNWTAHSGTGNIPVGTGSLSYDGLLVSAGNKISIPGTTAVTKDINRAVSTASTTVLYYSALVNVPDNTGLTTLDNYFLSFGATDGAAVTSLGGRLATKLGTVSGFRFSIQNTSTGATSYSDCGQDLSFGTTYLVVVKYDRSVSPTVATLWVNPATLGGSEPAVTATNASGTGTFAAFKSIAIRNSISGGAATPKAEIDEIRVGTTFASVTPLNQPPVASFNPTNLSVTADPTTNIVITFDKAVRNIDASAIADPTSLIILKETDASGADVAFTATINAGKTEITIDPTAVLGFNKAYYVAVAPVEDIVAKESAIQSATFTTRVQDVVAPLWTDTYPKVSAIANSDFNLLVSLDEKGKAYYVVLPDGGTVPTAAQVKAGTDGVDGAALKAGSINVTAAATEYSVNISGLVAATTYDVYVVAEDIELTPNLQVATSNILNLTTTDTKPEPTNQASDLVAVVDGQTSLTLNWMEAVGAQLPAGYLILVNETGTFVDPVDGVAQADGASAINVAYDLKSKQLTGLTAGTQYFFKMYSYTNTGTAIDYLLTAPVTANVSLPKLAVTYPNGGEVFYAGDTVSVTWTSANITNVNIEVSSDNGVNWMPVVGPIASDGQDSVAIPAKASYSNQYMVRISDASNSAFNDISDAAFTVKAVTSDLVDLLTMPHNAVVKYTGKATVTYARTARNQKYIQDGTGAVVIDDATAAPGFINGTYAIGDGITNIEGKVFLYNGLVEFVPSFTTGEPCTGNPVITPEVRTIESLTHLDQCKLVRIENFSFAATGIYATSSAFAASKNYDITGYLTAVFAFRTLFAESDYIGTEIPLTPVTAVCLVGQFNTTMQITARNLADITSTAAYVTSDLYTVDFAAGTIVDVPEADNLATFKGNLIVAPSASFNVFDADGVTPATVLDNTKLVVVTAQDGTTKKTYSISITVYVPSTVANLIKLSVNGSALNGFLSGTLNYTFTLKAGATGSPTVTYILADPKSSAVLTNATDIYGSEAARTTTVAVTAEDGITTKTYSIVFTVYVPSIDASLSSLSYNATSVPTFAPGTTTYDVLLPYGTTVIPTVTYVLSDAKSAAVIANATNLIGTLQQRTTTVTVTAEDAGYQMTYTIVYTLDSNIGISKPSVSGISIYPVPVADQLTVSGIAKVNRIEILDVTGKVLRNVEVNSDEVTLNVSDLRKGMYFLKTESQTFKFIKK